jgi:sugar lactone lactonase YvrE
MRRGSISMLVAFVAFAGLVGCEDDEDPPCGAPGDLCHVAGTGEFGFNHDGLPPEETDLFLVSSARPGPDGLLCIMDFNNQRFRRVDEDGLVQTMIGNGFHAFADVDLPLDDTPLENPIDFDFFSDGTVVFVSYHDPRVLTVGEDGTLESLAGAPDGILGVEGNEGDGGPAVDALFIQLDGIAVTDDDVIYVSDSMANRVRKIEDGIIDTVAGTGEATYGGDGGPGTEAALHWPTALELDPEGNLYIADTFNHVVRRLSTDGTITTVVGSGTQGFAGDGGPGTQAQFDQPIGLALAEDGTLYVSDRGNVRVRRVGPDGIIDTVAGSGVEGRGRSGPALDSPLGSLSRVALDGDTLLVTDQANAMIWRLHL